MCDIETIIQQLNLESLVKEPNSAPDSVTANLSEVYDSSLSEVTNSVFCLFLCCGLPKDGSTVVWVL